MIPVELHLINHQLCVVSESTKEELKCYPATRGKLSTPTPLGTHTITSITPSSHYTNPWLIVFKETNNTTYAIHSWNTPIPVGQYSHGCIRLNSEDLNDILQNYLFNTLQVF
jgi:lipoprotein-anchoring transpeptidase ErfK/SrfK